jgi:hypothetical protein
MLENEGATTDEIAATDVVEEEVPKSMDDTIRDTLRSLKEKGAEIEGEPEAEKPAKVRDEKGKFAPEKPLIKEVEQVSEKPEVPVKPAPNTWRKDVAEKWSTLPPEVQSEVERREADFHKGIETYKQKAQFADVMTQAIAPHMNTLQSLNVSPDVAVRELLQADNKLRYSPPEQKQAYFAELARAYGVDLGQVANIPQPDPNVSAMAQRVQQLEGWIQQQSLMGQQQEQAKLNSEISSFASDPTHSHFESVRGHMAALLQAGQAKDLQDAYEQAVWANPQTRTSLIAQQQAEAKAKATQTAQAAKQAASVNTRARPSMPISQPIGTMDDTIRATLRRLQNA